jgi:cbb3-type cytochrome oxidase cytochrome c subunit
MRQSRLLLVYTVTVVTIGVLVGVVFNVFLV